LRHYLRDALRISGKICELRGGQRGGGEQHEAKVCHDNPEIPKTTSTSFLSKQQRSTANG
jgi:hypothetical protein